MKTTKRRGHSSKHDVLKTISHPHTCCNIFTPVCTREPFLSLHYLNKKKKTKIRNPYKSTHNYLTCNTS